MYNKEKGKLLSFELTETNMRQFVKFLESGPGIGEMITMIESFNPETVNTLTAAMYSGRCMTDGTSGEVKATPDEELAYSMETCGYPALSTKDEYGACPILTKSPKSVAEYITAFLEHFAGVTS